MPQLGRNRCGLLAERVDVIALVISFHNSRVICGCSLGQISSIMFLEVAVLYLMPYRLRLLPPLLSRKRGNFCREDDALRLAVLVMRGRIRSDTRFATAACWIQMLGECRMFGTDPAWRAPSHHSSSVPPDVGYQDHGVWLPKHCAAQFQCDACFVAFYALIVHCRVQYESRRCRLLDSGLLVLR